MWSKKQNCYFIMVTKTSFFNRFHITGFFLYLLKISENQSFYDVFQGHTKRPVAWNELMTMLWSFFALFVSMLSKMSSIIICKNLQSNFPLIIYLKVKVLHHMLILCKAPYLDHTLSGYFRISVLSMQNTFRSFKNLFPKFYNVFS